MVSKREIELRIFYPNKCHLCSLPISFKNSYSCLETFTAFAFFSFFCRNLRETKTAVFHFTHTVNHPVECDNRTAATKLRNTLHSLESLCIKTRNDDGFLYCQLPSNVGITTAKACHMWFNFNRISCPQSLVVVGNISKVFSNYELLTLEKLFENSQNSPKTG